MRNFNVWLDLFWERLFEFDECLDCVLSCYGGTALKPNPLYREISKLFFLNRIGTLIIRPIRPPTTHPDPYRLPN